MNNEELKLDDEQQVTGNQEETTTVDTDDSGAGHKVLFFIIMGIVCLSGIGIPVAIFVIWRMHKKLDQYKKQFGELPKKETAPAPAAEEPKTEDSTKSEETK